MSKYLITNAIPYVNARPHIGHALEFVQSDVIRRYHQVFGDETLLLCGGDENAIKNVQAAEEADKPIQEFVDENTELFYQLSKKLNVAFDVWQKGSAPNHHTSSQKLWELCTASGAIYKKKYEGPYCVGCELFYEKKELNEKGECEEHPGKPLEEVSEENYFFRLSNYEPRLKEIFSSGQIQISPQHRTNEVLAFINQGLKDISISRSNKRAKNWGVPVPNDATQRMYVWFDALNIYQSGIGFGAQEPSEGARLQGEAEDKRGSTGLSSRRFTEKDYRYWWPADLHVIGKGILRFHAVYWPAFLLSAKLPLPKAIFVHDYITVDGQKMSKTLGNVLDPLPLIEKYDADALRYYLLSKISPFADGDFSEEKFKEVYNADLANGLGNLVARVARLCESANFTVMGSENRNSTHLIHTEAYSEALLEFRFNDALSSVWEKIGRLDKYLDDEKPWALQKTNDQRLKTILAHAVDQIQEIAALLEPFLPETAKKIESQFKGPKIVSQKPLFPRA